MLKIAWDGHSWLGCGDLPSIAAVFFPKVGWTHGKSQQCPGTNLLFQRGSDWQTKKTSSFLSIKLVTIWAQSDAIQKIDRYSPEKRFLQWIALSISRTTEAWVRFPRLPVSSRRNVLYERSSDKFSEERLVTGLKHSDVLKKCLLSFNFTADLDWSWLFAK